MNDEMTSEEMTQQLIEALVALDDMQAKLAHMERARTEPIAIVGVACRFPGQAHGPRAYWQLIRDGRDAVTEVPRDRWDADAYYAADRKAPGKMVSRRGAFVDNITEFDAEFFDMFPHEAALLDPQQRLLLQTAWEALEDAAIPPDALAGSKTGVFVGACTMDYALLQFREPTQIAASSTVGCSPALLANRLSYTLDLKGPSLTIDTACSSSLVAIHQAANSLRAGETELAIVGGVNAVLSPEFGVSFSKLGLLSPDGRCKTFDAGANGYVRGEGCGVVVLKRLSEALAARDHVWGVIRGSAVNQDGRTNGITAPNGAAQVAVMRDALKQAELEPSQVTYIEAHGIGTAIGDAIEAEAISTVYGAADAGAPCFLGSVKPNIGHLEGAAGIAAIIKTVLCLAHEAIPPVVHFRELNPEISFDGRRFTIPTAVTAWSRGAEPRRAGVSAFGFGGTNAHVILEEAPSIEPREIVTPSYFVLPISARSEAALRALARRMHHALAGADAAHAADACLTAAVGRTHHAYRDVVVARTVDELVAGLHAAAMRAPSPDGTGVVGAGSRLAFVAGTSAHRAQRAIGDATWRAVLDECDAVWTRLAGWSLSDRLSSGDHAAIDAVLDLVEVVARARGLHACGVSPELVIGRGRGELAAAVVAGVLGLAEAVELVHAGSGVAPRRPGSVPYLALAGDAAIADVARSLAERQIHTLVELATESVREPATSRLLAAALAERARSTTAFVPWHSTVDESDALIDVLATLYRQGRNVDWSGFASEQARKTPLPVYPWQGQSLWFTTKPAQPAAMPSKPAEVRTAEPVVDRFRDRPFRLASVRRGVLDGLQLVDASYVRPGRGEVAISVSAAGLNFRDVLRALDTYPGSTSAEPALGDECCGHVVEVGQDVTGFAVGDRVIAVGPHCLASHVTTLAALVWHAPASLSAAQAAAIPIAYATASYGLVTLGRLQRGERVLIHSATGGVGLAALQIARARGVEIFATAGTAAKRAQLESMGIRHVYDSRSLAFVDEILRDTRGEGVDVVLNSLAGEAIARGLAVLRDEGRFIEIGKRDIYANGTLDLAPFRRRLSFAHLDLGAMLHDRVDVVSRLVRDALDQIESGVLRALPVVTRPLSEAAEVFAEMAQARHIGKLVLSIEGSSAITSVAASVDAPRSERPAGSVEQIVLEHIAGALRLSPAAVDRDASLRDLGLDSLLVLELRNVVQRELGVSLSVVKLATLPSIAAIAAYIAEKHGAVSEPACEPACALEPACAVPRAGGSLMIELAPLDEASRTTRIARFIADQLAQTLKLDTRGIDGRMSLRDLGLDSLLTLELRNRLRDELGVSLSVVKLAALPTLHSIAEYVAARLSSPSDSV